MRSAAPTSMRVEDVLAELQEVADDELVATLQDLGLSDEVRTRTAHVPTRVRCATLSLLASPPPPRQGRSVHSSVQRVSVDRWASSPAQRHSAHGADGRFRDAFLQGSRQERLERLAVYLAQTEEEEEPAEEADDGFTEAEQVRVRTLAPRLRTSARPEADCFGRRRAPRGAVGVSGAHPALTPVHAS